MLTVLFATRNRADLLARVLESYTTLDAPAGGWRLVIVDNGSSDGTAGVLQAYQTRLPLTALREPRLGKNQALTTGLQAASGDLTVLTDDDVFPRRDWLPRLREAADAHPAHAIFGGAVLPRWETPPPAWVLRSVPLSPVYAVTNPRLQSGPIDAHDVFGPNMMVRSAVFTAGHGFDPTIGPRGSNYAMGSESEFVRRLIRAGYTAWHVADAVVEHFVRAAQLHPRWILGRAVRYGRGQYRLSYANDRGPAPVIWAGVPRYLFRELLRSGAGVLQSLLTLNREAIFRARWKFNFVRGRALEARRLHGGMPAATHAPCAE